MTEFGNLSLVEMNPETEMDNNKISLPGVVRGIYLRGTSILVRHNA